MCARGATVDESMPTTGIRMFVALWGCSVGSELPSSYFRGSYDLLEVNILLVE